MMETSRKRKMRRAILGTSSDVRAFAIFTAENPMGKSLPPDENARLNGELTADLKAHHLLYGHTVGKFNTVEHSFIVYNIALADALFLNGKYRQKSFFYCIVDPNGESGKRVRFQYWETPDDKMQYRMVEETSDIIRLDDAEADYFTAPGRRFKFRIPLKALESVENLIGDRMKEPVFAERFPRIFSESMDDSLTYRARACARAKLYGDGWRSWLK